MPVQNAFDKSKPRGAGTPNLAAGISRAPDSIQGGCGAGKGNVFDIKIHADRGAATIPQLTRMAAPEAQLTRFDVRPTVLRAGERRVAGMRAQEWLAWTTPGAEKYEKTFGFTLETMRAAPGVSAQRRKMQPGRWAVRNEARMGRVALPQTAQAVQVCGSCALEDPDLACCLTRDPIPVC
jgi:hypothetical protein